MSFCRPALAAILSLTAAAQAQVVSVNLVAAVGTTQVAPGVTVNAWMYGGQMPGQVLRIVEGQSLQVRFRNDLPESTAVHWHGQPVPLGMDGVPGISRPAVAPGQEFIYDLPNLVPGTYWYHAHGAESQLDVGLAGVLVVDPANPANDPTYDVEQTIVLDEWSNPLGGSFAGHLLNGRNNAGQAPIVVQPGQQLRLRVVNVSATTNYVFALDGHPMTVTHADGNRVQPVSVQAIPIGIGERYDVLVDCNNPGVWSLAASSITNRSQTLVRAVLQYSGQSQTAPSANYVPSNLSGGSLLSYAQLAAFHPVTPIVANPDRTVTASLGMTMGPGGMAFTINGQLWPSVTPIQVATNDEVQMTVANTGMGMMQAYHPMHIHGHFFRLMGTTGGTANPPLKDTLLIRPPGQAWSSIPVQMTMNNPGRWLFHCHNMDHMATGMMTSVDYLGDEDLDGIESRVDFEPTRAQPVLTIPTSATNFAPGAVGSISAQWTPGQAFVLFAGLAELPTPVALPPYGELLIDPTTAVPLGVQVASTTGAAQFGYAIPNNANLIGFQLPLQGVGTTGLAGGLRFSTFQAMTIR